MRERERERESCFELSLCILESDVELLDIPGQQKSQMHWSRLPFLRIGSKLCMTHVHPMLAD